MDTLTLLKSLGGGATIGLAAALMLLFNGRIAGVSGISKGLLAFTKGDYAWRAAFVAGLILGGIAYGRFDPTVFDLKTDRPLWIIALAGLLVGFGTVLSNGCTSGHGICGVSRLSRRSITAVATFVATGMLTATAYHFIAG